MVLKTGSRGAGVGGNLRMITNQHGIPFWETQILKLTVVMIAQPVNTLKKLNCTF